MLIILRPCVLFDAIFSKEEIDASEGEITSPVSYMLNPVCSRHHLKYSFLQSTKKVNSFTCQQLQKKVGKEKELDMLGEIYFLF